MDDFIDGAITPIVEQEAISFSKSFKPWHKPRKQWCRFHQWFRSMNWIIDSFDKTRSKEFKYLGLPGDELIDLRMFAKGCAAKNISLKYLGFNTIADKEFGTSELALSESELYKTYSIAPGSMVIQEPLESLSNIKSSAYDEAKSFSGFHMINFDLCSSIATKGADHAGDTYFKALHNLITLQNNYMTECWSLFVTTNVSRQAVVTTVMKSLLEAIKLNAYKHTDFHSAMNETLFIDLTKLEQAIGDLNSLTDDEFFDLFALGFSKWLLHCFFQKDSSWQISMVESCKYSTAYHANTHVMLSLGFRFRYQPQDAVNDPLGLGVKVEDNANKIELNCALPMIQRVNEIFNLDSRLEANPELMDKLIDESAKLLSQARYNPEEYVNWVAKGCPAQ